MSIFFPYSPDVVITYLSNTFSLDLSGLSSYQTTILMIAANLYFFLFWGFIIYISLKIFNRVWERFF